MKKIAIYTVLTGGYDQLKQPSVTDERFDYICFSNDIPKDCIGVWEIRKFDGKFSSKQIESRYPKMHPWIVLSQYEYSVYMDANIRIASKDFYECVIQKIESGAILSGVKHPFRDCCYNEGYSVITYNLDKIANVIRVLRHVRQQGLPRHYGMFEANIILRRHDNEKMHRQCELWWEMINKYSRRDQLSYPYTLWKEGLPFDYLLPENENARNCPWLQFESHVREKNIWGKKLNRIGRFIYRKIVGFEK